ncbi:hypothetical protein MCHIJ_13770 [Mycolicibacterium chitae]|nr:hypothetical protein MCHIJ_13770 [Mycolicibacterium chitae]
MAGCAQRPEGARVVAVSPAASPLAQTMTPTTTELALEPVESTLPPAAVVADMICRDGWRAQSPTGSGVEHTITKMTIHHTGTALGDNRNAPSRLLQHQRLHQNDRGWIDIAYHVGVDRNGNIYELRDWRVKGDTATEYNPEGHFLVLCEGNFDEEAVTPEQLEGAAKAFAWAASTFNVSLDELKGHRDFAATACPGADLYSKVKSGELKGLVTDLLARGPVELREICGPEAAERVAAIEAGT